MLISNGTKEQDGFKIISRGHRDGRNLLIDLTQAAKSSGVKKYPEVVSSDWFKMEIGWHNANLEQEMENLACDDLACDEEGSRWWN